jgi:hypothetical protein
VPVFTLLGLGIFFLGMAVGFGLATGEDDEAVTVTVAERVRPGGRQSHGSPSRLDERSSPRSPTVTRFGLRTVAASGFSRSTRLKSARASVTHARPHQS